MMYGDLYNIMSPQEFRAKYSQAECKALDAQLDQLEANLPCELSEKEINRLDEFVCDLTKVQKYQNEQEEAALKIKNRLNDIQTSTKLKHIL